jgi:predicted nucleic acid-binding protein
MIHSARDSAEAARISTWLHAFDYLRCDDDTFTRALEIQRHALNAGFHRALSLPDLLIAATAERNRHTVLHYDGDFDMIADLTGQPTQWVVPPGSADR